IGAIAALRVDDVEPVRWAGETALISCRATGLAFVDRRTAGEQSVGERRAAIILQRPDQRVDRRNRGAELIGKLRGRDGPAGRIADKVEVIGGQRSAHVRATRRGVKSNNAVTRSHTRAAELAVDAA